MECYAFHFQDKQLHQMKILPEINTKNVPVLTKISMFLLASFSVLSVYRFAPSQLNYSYVLGLCLFLISLFKRQMRNPYPITYFIFWGYCAIQIIIVGGATSWQDFLPGGISFFIFSLCMAGFILNYNFDCLRKYLTYIWIFAAVLFFVQWILYYTTGQKISLFLPLGNELTYEGFSWSELHYIQISSSSEGHHRFSSIFAEPSYLGQYSLIALCMELFCNEHKSKLFTPLAGLICVVIILLQSGVGLLGMTFIALIKLLYIIFITRKTKYYIYLILIVPLLFLGISEYLGSTAGQYIAGRMNQLSFDDETATNSGFVRLYYGYFAFSDLNIQDKIIGVSRQAAQSMRDYDGFYNGISFIMCSFGIIGLFLMLVFIFLNCYKKNILVNAMALLFIIVSAIESTYLSAIMMMTFVIVSAKDSNCIYNRYSI